MKKIKDDKKENMISFIYQFRNKLNALFGDDSDFMIYEIDEPLPDGTIEYHEGGRTLNIVSSNIVKLTLLRDYLGDTFEDGATLYLDYYFGRTLNKGSFVNICDRPSSNARLDIAMLFEGNPHFSKFYSGYGNMGPWFCVAFKPELIQYYTEDATSLHGRRSCAMEEIAYEIFPHLVEDKIYFSTENKEDFTGKTPTITASVASVATYEGYGNYSSYTTAARSI